MLSSGILDFAIGMVFTFLAVSLAAGTVTEAVASALNWRARTLLQGIKSHLNDPNFGALAGELYQHGLINPRGDGSKPEPADTKKAQRNRKNPSYIDPGQFAAAFLDVIKGLPANVAVPAPAAPQQEPVAALKAAVDAKMPPARNMLHGIIDRAKGDEDAIRKELSTWFDNSMDRVSGAYKRWAQLLSFIFAFAIAVLLNISAIDIATSLWNHPVDTTALATIKEGDLKGLFTNLDMLHQKTALPIGWPAAASSQWYTLFFGWVITALASLFGAPFWFDALQQIVRLKGSGPSPGEKAANTAAANGKPPAAAAPA
jgi:hypothetical protein